MKKLLCFIFMGIALPVLAYQTGSVSRPQFKTAPAATDEQTDEKEKPSVPGQQGVQTRSFTSYGTRPGNAWRKGVQTKTVQTQTAARAATPKDEDNQAVLKGATQLTQQNKIAKTAKGAAPQQSSAPKATPKAGNQTAQKPAAQAAQPAQPTQDAAAMMQQLQGLQNMMGALNGGGTSGAAQGTKGAAGGSAMPAGMPDLSALMNMAGQGNTGKK